MSDLQLRWHRNKGDGPWAEDMDLMLTRTGEYHAWFCMLLAWVRPVPPPRCGGGTYYRIHVSPKLRELVGLGKDGPPYPERFPTRHEAMRHATNVARVAWVGMSAEDRESIMSGKFPKEN